MTDEGVIRLRIIARTLVLMLIMVIYSTNIAASDGNSTVQSKQETLTSLVDKGLRFHPQSFEVAFENWGKVRIVTGIDIKNFRVLCIYIADDKDKVLYKFPLADEIRRLRCDEVKAIAFMDIDKDGLADVIVIGIYNTGVNITKNRFYAATVYFQKGKEFINDPDLDEQINRAHKNKTIDMALEFLEGRFQ